MPHYHISVYSPLHPVETSRQETMEEASAQYEKTIQLLKDLSGSTVVDVTNNTVFLSDGDTVTWFECTWTGGSCKHRSETHEVDKIAVNMIAFAELVSKVEFESDYPNYINMEKVGEILSSATVNIIKALTELNYLIQDIANIWTEAVRAFSYAYETIFSGFVSYGREIKRVSLYGAKKILRFNSPSLNEFKRFDWHFPERPCRKIYERHNVRFFMKSRRNK